MAKRVFKKSLLQKEFGNIIRAKRENMSMTQELLAEKSDLTTNYIGSLERGERNVGLVVIYKLAEALNTHAKNLLPDYTGGKTGIPGGGK